MEYRKCPFCDHPGHIDEAADKHCVVCGCYPYPAELIDELDEKNRIISIEVPKPLEFVILDIKNETENDAK